MGKILLNAWEQDSRPAATLLVLDSQCEKISEHMESIQRFAVNLMLSNHS